MRAETDTTQVDPTSGVGGRAERVGAKAPFGRRSVLAFACLLASCASMPTPRPTLLQDSDQTAISTDEEELGAAPVDVREDETRRRTYGHGGIHLVRRERPYEFMGDLDALAASVFADAIEAIVDDAVADPGIPLPSDTTVENLVIDVTSDDLSPTGVGLEGFVLPDVNGPFAVELGAVYSSASSTLVGAGTGALVGTGLNVPFSGAIPLDVDYATYDLYAGVRYMFLKSRDGRNWIEPYVSAGYQYSVLDIDFAVGDFESTAGLPDPDAFAPSTTGSRAGGLYLRLGVDVSLTSFLFVGAGYFWFDPGSASVRLSSSNGVGGQEFDFDLGYDALNVYAGFRL